MTSRLESMLDELEAQVDRARGHEATMQAGLAESATWSLADDREWIEDAAAYATAERVAVEGRLAQARRIVDRANGTPPARAEARCCVECGEPIQPRQLYIVDGPLHIRCASLRRCPPATARSVGR